MPKPYHPCYTNVNPAEEARKYTSAEVRCRKVRLIYDWFPPEREVDSWLRIVPYRLKKGEKEGSWIVRYFEFHAGIAPLPRVGFIGDLWISWGASDPSIWFKLEEMKWERWGGCMSSVRAQMNAKHPFLDKAYLWFSPRNFFFRDETPYAELLSLQWDRLERIRRIAPTTRVIDPDGSPPPKMGSKNPVELPSVENIVRTLCPGMPTLESAAAPPTTLLVTDRGDGYGDIEVMSTSGVQDKGLQGQFPIEDIDIGDDVEIDWDWWGSSDGEAEDEIPEAGGPQPRVPRYTPSPITSSRNSRYHPYRPASSTTPFRKFRPPSRYTRGTFGQSISPNDPCNFSVPSSPSASTTIVDPRTSTPRMMSESISFDSKDDLVPREPGIPQDNTPYAQKPSQRTLEGVMRIIREDGHNQSGIWALLPPGLCDRARGELAAELPIPILDLGCQASHKIERILRRDGFPQHGILVLKMWDPSDDEVRDICGEMVKQEI